MKKYLGRPNLSLWVVFFFAVYVVLVIKYVTLENIDQNAIFGAYSILVSFYILSRFFIAYFYHGDEHLADMKLSKWPSVSFAVPAKDEEENIFKTLKGILEIDYPKNKFEIIAVNDGSRDGTFAEMLRAKSLARKKGIKMTVVDWKKNRGKREGMAEGVKRARGEYVIFIDSDSFVERAIAKELVKYFVDPRVAAVAGHGFVANSEVNMLTKMQDVRYYVAFKGYKSAEAIFGAVTCCSGCCSAYRKSAVMEVLDTWRKQKFLGVQCTYGDDRALTNYLLARGYTSLYSPKAVARTVVPETFSKFMKQQLRWKKSWLRESFKASFFMWKKNPIASASFYIGVILPLMAPFVVARALVWYPLHTGQLPYVYLFGLVLMAFIYSLYYFINTHSRHWVYGMLFSTLYGLVLVWQLPYALLNIRDSRWGTR